MIVMRVTVLYFSTLKKATGLHREELQLAPGSSLSDLLTAVTHLHPDVAAHLPSLLLSRNQEWSPREAVLQEGDEVALMPPVSGG